MVIVVEGGAFGSVHHFIHGVLQEEVLVLHVVLVATKVIHHLLIHLVKQTIALVIVVEDGAFRSVRHIIQLGVLREGVLVLHVVLVTTKVNHHLLELDLAEQMRSGCFVLDVLGDRDDRFGFGC